MHKKTNRVIFIGKMLLTAAFAVFLLLIIQKDYHKAKLKTLNYFRPESFEYLLTVDPKDENKSWFIEYVVYYQKIARHVPVYSEAYEILGYCFYHLGKYQDAISAYRKSAHLHPGFFWPQYNLGVIYFKMGQYQAAAEAFKNALAANPAVTVQFLSTSRIYKSILPQVNSRDLFEARRKLPILIVLSYYAARPSDGKTFEKNRQQAELLEVKIF